MIRDSEGSERKIKEIDDLEDTLLVLEQLVTELKSQKNSSPQLKIVNNNLIELKDKIFYQFVFNLSLMTKIKCFQSSRSFMSASSWLGALIIAPCCSNIVYTWLSFNMSSRIF